MWARRRRRLSHEKKAIAVELGGQPREALQILTFFRARQAPVHIVPIKLTMCLALLLMHVLIVHYV
jgi:hypothetical protein